LRHQRGKQNLADYGTGSENSVLNALRHQRGKQKYLRPKVAPNN